MMGLVQTAWLFTRGSDSVRIVRVAENGGAARLLVQGPGTEAATYAVSDSMEAVRLQSQLERDLVTQGYQLALFRSAERRTGRDRRGAARGADRRRPPLELVG